MEALLFPLGRLLAYFGFHPIEDQPVKVCTACETLTGTEKLVCLADEFKAMLSASQIATLQLDYTLANAKTWSNLPVTFDPRLGIRFGDLNARQLAAAKALVKAAMGTKASEGYDEMFNCGLPTNTCSTTAAARPMARANISWPFWVRPR